MKNLFVITPAYNAAATLERVFARMPPEVNARVREYVVVNDGSTDRTAEVLETLRSRLAKLTVLNHEKNRGYGGAEKTLLRHALGRGADVVAMVHADGQYAPEKLPEILALFDAGEAEVVQGSRMLGGGALRGGMPLYKYLANRALTFCENRAFGLRLAEYHSGYMTYARPFLEAVPFEQLSDSFDFDLEMIVACRILGRRLREVAIPTQYADEVSHLNPIRYGMDVLSIIRRFRRGDYHRMLGVNPG